MNVKHESLHVESLFSVSVLGYCRDMVLQHGGTEPAMSGCCLCLEELIHQFKTAYSFLESIWTETNSLWAWVYTEQFFSPHSALSSYNRLHLNHIVFSGPLCITPRFCIAPPLRQFNETKSKSLGSRWKCECFWHLWLVWWRPQSPSSGISGGRSL